MSIHRKTQSKKGSWLSKFWHWLFHNAQPAEEEASLYLQPPEALPAGQPCAKDYASVYQMLDSRPALIAGNGGNKGQMLSVYSYCGVVFYKADTLYHYINPGIELSVGDRVLVPVHIHGGTQLAEGYVVSCGEYLAQYVPYPAGLASMVIKKL